MIPLFDHSDIVKRWAEPRLNTVIAEPAYGMGFVNRAGQLCTAAIYNAYEARNVELTYVGTLLPGIARMVFSYAFNHLECLRISVTVPADHVEHLDQAQRWGWVIEGRKRNYYGEGQDAVILGMLREECWILRHAKPTKQSNARATVAAADGSFSEPRRHGAGQFSPDGWRSLWRSDDGL